MPMSMPDAVRWWISQYKFWPLPVPWKEKGATLKDWPNLRLTLDKVDLYFNGEPQNVSLLMGDPDNLTDVDIDSGEARWASPEYLPATGLKWGRRSNPASHHLYYTDPMALTAKYADGDACLIEIRCRTKEGKLGFPVVAPPSVHPSGEAYEFTGSPGQPARVQGPWLGERVRLIAAASLVGRHAKQGLYHETFIALAGTLARSKWDLEEAQRLLRAIYRVIWHESANLGQANSDANSTYQSYDDGHETTGLTRLSELLDERVFKSLKQWLGFEWQDGHARAQPPPKKKPPVLPGKEPMEQLRNREITTPEWLIEDLIKIPSVTLLVSPPKVGKTVLAMQMTMSIVNGLALFDNYRNYARAGEAAALFVEWDDLQAEASLKAFLLACRASRPNQPIDYVIRPRSNDFTIGDPEFKPWLITQIRQRPARICVLDSLTALRGFSSDDRSKSVVKLDAGEITMLGEVSVETECALVVVHHDSKTAANLDLFSRAAGTYALQACSEAQVVLGRFPELALNDPTRLMSVRGRHLRGIEAVLRFREESLDFDFILDGAGARHYPELRQLLHAFRGTAFDAKRVHQETGWSQAKCYVVLSQLVGADILRKDSTSWIWNPTWQRTLEQI